MPPYKVYLHIDLLDVAPKRDPQKTRIMNFIRSLANNPSLQGDFTDKDDSLRTRQINVVGDYAITWWADHASKAVMVVDIRLADQ